MNLLSKIGGWLGAGKGADKAKDQYSKSLEEYGNLYQPSVGELGANPIGSAYNETDPMVRQYQMKAIEDLRNNYQQGGLDANAVARLEDIRRSEDAQARGAREAIMQNARSRGMGGGSIVDQLINAQRSADRRSAADTQVSADAETRALQSLRDSAGFAGAVRGQDYQKAGALDAISKFNQNNKTDAYQNRFNNAYNVTNQRAGVHGDIAGARRGAQDQKFGAGAGILKELYKNAKKGAETYSTGGIGG